MGTVQWKQVWALSNRGRFGREEAMHSKAKPSRTGLGRT